MTHAHATDSPPSPQLGEAVCVAIRDVVHALGLSIEDEPRWELANFSTQPDPYSGESSWVGEWRGGKRYGTVTLFPDGRVFAEYQVLAVLATEPPKFVESVQVWGNGTRIKGEPVIVPMPT